MRMDTENPDIDFARQREFEKSLPPSVYVERNRQEGRLTWVERNPDVRDFYDDNDQFTVTNVERNRYSSFLEGLDPGSARCSSAQFPKILTITFWSFPIRAVW